MKDIYTKPVLIVDDDPNIVGTLERFLLSENIEAIGETDPQRALKTAREQGIEIVVSDIRMPDFDGIALLHELLDTDPNMMVILMTAHGSEEIAVEAMKAGAYHYLKKPPNLDEFLLLIKRAVDRLLLLRENKLLRTQSAQDTRLDEMIGSSPGLEKVRRLVKRVALSPVTVLITGESGTGKELVAKSLHQLSERSGKPFVRLNCAAIPETLLESELFGHEKGAFTGASARSIGKFELADGGTIFLDEIGEMKPTTQTKLLRFLQEHEFERIGGKDTIKVDVRIVAATNCDLARAIEEERFREDLYYRLNVIEIALPPLRERSEDIPLLVEHFLHEFARRYKKPYRAVPASIMEKMRGYSWPGNIRQLRNCIERAVILGSGSEQSYDFLEKSGGAVTGGPATIRNDDEVETLHAVEMRHIKRVLEFTGGNKTRAARLLDIDPKTLRSKLKSTEKGN